MAVEETQRPYAAKFPKGTKVRVAPRGLLESFAQSWKFHNKLVPNQLEYAGFAAEVETVGFYHGGDVLYKLKDVPGIWHEQCLESESVK